MRRTVSEAKVSEKKIRYKTRIEDDPSQEKSWEARRRLLNLIDTVAQMPDLLNCGPSFPHQLSFHHNGQCWVIEAEATVDQG